MVRRVSHQIDFAKRHLTTEVSTFNAYSALSRMDHLVHEIEELTPTLQPILNDRFAPAFFEFVSYYKVGFATCLEWHAKSRLYDLFCFVPKLIDSNDLKLALSNDKLKQMIDERLSVPQILANAYSVSTGETYITVFNRIFEAFGVGKNLAKILKTKSIDGETFGALLTRLFDERNALVHEISIIDIGHMNIRDFSTFEEIAVLGRQTMALMKTIEAEVRKATPEDFPNILESDGFPRDVDTTTFNKILAIEGRIAEELTQGEAQEFFVSREIWLKVSQERRAAIENELQFIEDLELPGRPYYDVRPYLKQKLLEGQLAYLESLSRQVLRDEAP
jgi:hypothetical protein